VSRRGAGCRSPVSSTDCRSIWPRRISAPSSRRSRGPGGGERGAARDRRALHQGGALSAASPGIRDGVFTAVAMNGAGVIHDVELALAGKTSEDVAARLPTDRSAWHGRPRSSSTRTGGGHSRGARVRRLRREGDRLIEGALPEKEPAREAYRLGVPVTVHVAVGPTSSTCIRGRRRGDREGSLRISVVLLPRRGALGGRLRQRRVGGHPSRGLPQGRLGGAEPRASAVPDHDRQHGLPRQYRADVNVVADHARRGERVPPDRAARDPLPLLMAAPRRAARLKDSFIIRFRDSRLDCVASEGGAPFVARRAMNLHGCALPHYAPSCGDSAGPSRYVDVFVTGSPKRPPHYQYGHVDAGRSGGFHAAVYGERLRCVERNRSERSKVASVAEWKPPREPGV